MLAAVLTANPGDLDTGELALDCVALDFGRVHALLQRYADLPPGRVDDAAITCAERNDGRVTTIDLRHFGVVAREGRFTTADVGRTTPSGMLAAAQGTIVPWAGPIVPTLARS